MLTHCILSLWVFCPQEQSDNASERKKLFQEISWSTLTSSTCLRANSLLHETATEPWNVCKTARHATTWLTLAIKSLNPEMEMTKEKLEKFKYYCKWEDPCVVNCLMKASQTNFSDTSELILERLVKIWRNAEPNSSQVWAILSKMKKNTLCL